MPIVWILGAGFSKPLGGPLLGKLLSPEAERDLDVRYFGSGALGTLHAQLVRFLFRYGLAAKKNNAVQAPGGQVFDGEDLWEDAEQFLDYLDTAAESNGPGRFRLLKILGDERLAVLKLAPNESTIQAIALTSRRLLVAECSGFLVGANPHSERWSPYRRWVEQLVAPEDVIITFNYDLVVETIRGFVKRPSSGSEATLLKLHGSVDWVLEGVAGQTPQDSGVIRRLSPNYVLEDPAEPAIAAPGPSKQRFSRGVFRKYWEEALDSLKSASAIVFIGYRFPPTDAEARERLLDAIRNNPNQYLPIHTVLGPKTASDDSCRLHGLLEHALSSKRRVVPPDLIADNLAPRLCYTIHQQPLWAEDFLSVIERSRVLRPDKPVA
jgi:hypothetical protein